MPFLIEHENFKKHRKKIDTCRSFGKDGLENSLMHIMCQETDDKQVIKSRNFFVCLMNFVFDKTKCITYD